MGYTTGQFIAFIRRTITDALNRQNTAAVVRSVMERFGVDYFNKESDKLPINQVEGLQDILDNIPSGGGGGTGLTPAQLQQLNDALPAPDNGTGFRVPPIGSTLYFTSQVTVAFANGGAITGEAGAVARNKLIGNWTLTPTSNAYGDYKQFADTDDTALVTVHYLSDFISDHTIDMYQIADAKLSTLIAANMAALPEGDPTWFGIVLYDQTSSPPNIYRYECAVSRAIGGVIAWQWFCDKISRT